MKHFWIIKAGTTFPGLARQYGDFEDWTCHALGTDPRNACVFDVRQEAELPAPELCSGVVVTGSHAMVTDSLAWSLALEEWIRRLVQLQVPFLGICYGHQLLAQAMGGRVGFHPQGREIGTVAVQLLAPASADPLFRSLPVTFDAHAVHAQTVELLPPGAVLLAANDYEPTHAFRVGVSAWGVQFHPEYDQRIMRAYIDELAGELAAAGRDVSHLRRAVRETPWARQVLERFGGIVEVRTE